MMKRVVGCQQTWRIDKFERVFNLFSNKEITEFLEMFFLGNITDKMVFVHWNCADSHEVASNNSILGEETLDMSMFYYFVDTVSIGICT